MNPPAPAEQLSIFLENRTGSLAHLLSLLGKQGINIRAVSLADTSDFGILRLLVSEPDRTASLLRDNGFTVGRTAVVAVELADTPGSLSGALSLMAANGINVEYMYACARRDSNRAIIVFRFDRTQDAINLLVENGRKVISGVELAKI